MFSNTDGVTKEPENPLQKSELALEITFVDDNCSLRLYVASHQYSVTEVDFDNVIEKEENPLNNH